MDLQKVHNGEIDGYKITSENYGIVFLENNKSLLITELKDNYEIIGNASGVFLLDKTLGRVACYWIKQCSYFHYKNWKKASDLGMVDNKQLNWLNFSLNDPIDKIISKQDRFFALLSRQGNVYLFGYYDGPIGLIPPELFGNEKIKHVACGRTHVMFVTENNNLYGTGCNQEEFKSPLGIDPSRNFKLSTDKFNIVKCNSPILKGKNIIQVEASYNCTFILTEDRELYSSGNPYLGNNGFDKDFLNPKNGFVKIKDNVETVITEAFFAALKTLNGEYFIFGRCMNAFGNIDSNLMFNNIVYGTNVKLINFDINKIKQLECSDGCSIIVSKDNKLYKSGYVYHQYFSQTSDYSEIDLSELITNWDERENIELKVNAGSRFIVIQSEYNKYKFNFTESLFKICDISFHFNDF